MIYDKYSIPNNDDEIIIQNLKQTQFWKDYGLQNKTFILNQKFPDISISDNVIVYILKNYKTDERYNLIIPYGEMLYPEFLDQFVQFQDYLFNTYNMKIYIIETVRCKEEQEKINNSPISILTNQNSFNSPHLFGLQIKFIPIIINKNKIEMWLMSNMESIYWNYISEQQKKFNLVWGGDDLKVPIRTMVRYEI